MGLNLKGRVIDSNDSGIQSTAELLDNIKEKVQDLGLPEYPKPQGSPKTLCDIDVSAISNQELGTLFTQYTAYAQYVSGQLAQAEAHYKMAGANLKRIEAHIRSKLHAERVPKAEISHRTKENGLWLEAEFELVRLFAVKTILEAHYKAYDKQASALSRIITLRELEFEKELRDNGIMRNRRRHQPQPQPTRNFGRS